MTEPVHVIGGGLAGSEAAWQIAQSGVPVMLHEMRPARMTEAHKGQGLAELVCSNSFRSDDSDSNAVGLIHHEMRQLGSLIMACGDRHQVPAGSALAVDRDGFSDAVTAALEAHPRVTIARGEMAGLPPEEWDNVIIATGPLTSPALAEGIRGLTGETSLAFFDAIAPIVHRESVDMETAWFQSRYDKAGPGGTGADYLNCPMDKAQYHAFVEALLAAEKTTNPHDPTVKPYAIVQLRQDNKLGTLFNMVGFQTKLKHGEQGRIFRMIPGLENAEFARLGGIHRNTYLNSPRLLDGRLRLKMRRSLRFAGQITGCEGYVESAAVGLLAGLFASHERLGRELALPPSTTALGALLNHITGGHIETIDAGPRSYQPMNINFGLFPPVTEAPRDENGKRLRGSEKAHARKRMITARAKQDLAGWIAAQNLRPAALPDAAE